MSIAPGERIGVYEVIAPLGEGGMGVVFRARDSRLQRDVAIKVLPDHLAQDAGLLARFEREAQLLAALNHPNIAHIYGLEQDGGVSCIVMELVEGDTLADRLRSGPFSLDESLKVAKQLADALEAAHERGIIHRDLKPANIKLTSDGVVKVLDFGLAKVIEPDLVGSASPGQLTVSPTLSVHATRAGVILGTAAYMSPEQARGKAVDRRTDIWAFGCVLFELLTGEQTFEAGDTVSDAIAAILTREPEWRALPPDTPPHIRALLRRCLQKDLQRRLPHIGVARLDIDDPPAETLTPVAAAMRPRWRRLLPFVVMSALGILATIGLTTLWFRGEATSGLVTRFAYALPEGQRFTDGFLSTVAISPDGTRIAYVANLQLYLKSMSDLTARPIPGAVVEQGDNIGWPVFSPDGRSLVYWTKPGELPLDRGVLKRIGLDGGPPVTLTELGIPNSISWDHAGILVNRYTPGTAAFVAGAGAGRLSEIVRVPENGGEVERLVVAKPDEMIQGAQILPDGDSVLFTVIAAPTRGPLPDDESWTNAHIVVESLRSGERKTLVRGGTSPRYVPSGHLVYAREGVVVAQPFDLRRNELTGSSVPVIEGVSRAGVGVFSAGFVQMSLSPTGTLVYIPGPTSSSRRDRDLVIVDTKGNVQRLDVPRLSYIAPRPSPDGRRIAVATDDGREGIIWVYNLSGATSMQRLTLEGRNRFPIWSHDGEYVFFQSERKEGSGIYSQRADSSAPAELLIAAENGVQLVPDSWTSDGKYLFFEKSRYPGNSLWTFSRADKKTAPFGDVESGAGFLLRQTNTTSRERRGYDSTQPPGSRIGTQCRHASRRSIHCGGGRCGYDHARRSAVSCRFELAGRTEAACPGTLRPPDSHGLAQAPA